MKRATRSRVLWWLDLAEQLTIAIIAGLGAWAVGAPTWGWWSVGWLTAQTVAVRQHISRERSRDEESR